MSRRRRTDTGKMSLFPFLDVLVCTMGSLILLLLVATSRIRAAAVDKAKQAAIQERAKSIQSPTPAPEPIVLASEPEPEVDPTTEWKTRIEQLTEERDVLRSQLAQSKSRLATALSAVMKTKVKAASTEDRLKAIRTQQEEATAERQRLQSEIDSLQSDLTDTEQRLTKAVERQQTAKSKFAFMPFDGRTGTTKRPILIECTAEYVRFLPEDVRLTPEMLNGFTTGFNPLLIASRELVHYWKAYERVHSADADPTKDTDSFETDLSVLNDREHEPYVLLLVRPNGAVAFHIAKTFLSQLKVPHGYELITDDMEIDTSNPDPEAERICRAAARQALVERVRLLEEVVRDRQRRADQVQLDPTARTFVPKEIDESATGFNRPKSGSSTKSSSTNGPVAASQSGGPTASPQPNGQSVPVSRSSQFAPSKSSTIKSDSNAVPRNGGLTPLVGQGRTDGRQVAQTGRSRSVDEPPEESLPQPNARRYENDDSKPFPFSGERTKSASTKDGVPGGPANKPSASRSDSRSSNDPRAANNSKNGSSSHSNMARMKRRYLMPRSGIGLEKAITIRISSRRVLIGGEYEIPVESGVKTQSLIDRVLIAMDRVQSDWPSAGEGYHWVPTIKYEVVPGGEQVHQRLNSALFDLGLVSHVEYLDSDPDVGQASSLSNQKRQAESLPHDGGGNR